MSADKDLFRFSLKDHGPGLSEQDQENLFKEFSRVGASKRQIGEGAGLGLAICKQVAELMGARSALKVTVKTALLSGLKLNCSPLTKKPRRQQNKNWR